MNKLLKDAIADAKAVRETALANAKHALEEAFAPKLQSMLSHKIKEEMSDEDETVEMEDEELTMEMDHEDDMTMEGEGGEPEMEDEVESEEDMEVSDEEEMSDDDLEEILRELEGEDDMDEMDDMGEMDDMDEMDNMEDEEVDLDEIIRALREEDEDTEDMDDMEDDKEAELEEAYKVIKFLRSKLNEINLLNAKLLFVNKLFKKGDLSEAKKMKIVETFDRVKTVREAKLVYSTLSESLTAKPVAKKPVSIKRRGLSEGFASTPTRATKKPIIENTAYNRFTELINYNK